MEPETRICTKCKSNPTPSYSKWCRECINAYSRHRYATDEEFRKKQRASRSDRDRLEDNRRTRKRIKQEVIAAYGGSCQCCKESHSEFLTVDHINGRPESHKGKNGYALHCLVKKEGFPDDYRVLCWNCNASLGLFGYCPHNERKVDSTGYGLAQSSSLNGVSEVNKTGL